MTPEQAAALRAPFPPEAIGQRPQGNVKLDFLGHAAVTDRLLEVDPNWWWEPFALDEEGLPKIQYGTKKAVLWIKLHVLNQERIEVGTCDVSKPELHKELVSDALKRGAMRFGVGLDLWSKEELHPDEEAPKKRRSGKSEPAQGAARSEPPQTQVAPSPAASRECATCGEPITGKVKVVDGRKYHDTAACKPGNPLVDEARAALAGATGEDVAHS